MTSPVLLVGLAALALQTGSAPKIDSVRPLDETSIQLVESWPIETMLDHPDIPDAQDVWLELIDGATRSLDFAEFYCSNRPGSRLEPIVVAIERAAARGVRVRWLAEEKFYATYPETLDRLDAHEGIEVRRFDVAKVMGGVLHAKYFVVDDRDAFIGSQNFDWRALEHIQELGVRIRGTGLVQAVCGVFQQDWRLAAGEPLDIGSFGGERPDFATVARVDGKPCSIRPAFSPKGWLPDPALFDLPQIVELLEDARKSVRIQLLTYKTKVRDGEPFGDIDDALRKAAQRGAKVELLIADWSKREDSLEALKSLQRVEGIEVRFVTIPAWSGGHVPFGRVAHAKYMVVDGERAWLGTSNWEHGYFHASRNLGVIVDGEAFAEQLERYFRTGWTSDYATLLDPDAEYTPPRIGE